MHLAIFSLPFKTAVRYRIPLVLWGENSAVEYGGADGKAMDWEMNREWLLRYGVTNGTVAEDWADADAVAQHRAARDELQSLLARWEQLLDEVAG